MSNKISVIGEWVEIEVEEKRVMRFKSSGGLALVLNNVTHYKRYDETHSMVRHSQGITFFANDDVSHITSSFADNTIGDWVV